jgi:hypothetical protein
MPFSIYNKSKSTIHASHIEERRRVFTIFIAENDRSVEAVDTGNVRTSRTSRQIIGKDSPSPVDVKAARTSLIVSIPLWKSG